MIPLIDQRLLWFQLNQVPLQMLLSLQAKKTIWKQVFDFLIANVNIYLRVLYDFLAGRTQQVSY